MKQLHYFQTALLAVCLLCITAAQAQQLRWHWATQAINTGDGHLCATRCDSVGNIYLCGNFSDTLRFDTLSAVTAGQRDIFWVKLNATGQALWLSSGGSEAPDYPTAMYVSPGGLIYTAGLSGKAARFGTQVAGEENTNLFISCHSAEGELKWVSSFGARPGHYITSVIADTSGNVYAGGYFDKQLVLDEQHRLSAGGRSSSLLLSLDTLGRLRWAGQPGEPSGAGASVSAVKSSRITAMHLQGDSLWLGGEENGQVFISRSSLEGEITNTYTPFSAGNAQVGSLATAANGRLVVGGNFADSLVAGASSLYAIGNNDMFIAALDSAGSVLWQQQLGSAGYDKLFEVSGHPGQHIIATGLYSGALLSGADTVALGNTTCDVFVASLSPGGALQEVKAMGAPAEQYPLSMHHDPQGHVYVGGLFRDTATVNRRALIAAAGKEEVFLAKLYHCNKHRIVFSCDTVFTEGHRHTLQLQDQYEQYSWDQGASQAPAYVIEYSKTYQVLVSDSLGCAYRDSVTVKQAPAVPQLQIRAQVGPAENPATNDVRCTWVMWREEKTFL